MKCPHCEKEIASTDRFCPHCDGYVQQNSTPAANSDPSTKKCSACRGTMPKNSTFCPHCGKRVSSSPQIDAFDRLHATPPSAYYSNTARSSNGFAIAGFVLSLLSSPIFGLIFSCIGRSKAAETNSGGGLAMAGIIISVVSLALSFIGCVQICSTLSTMGY